MKKIFTILLGLAIWSTGWAALKVNPKIHSEQFTKDVATRIQQNGLSMEQMETKGMFENPDYTRVWQDASGFLWVFDLYFTGDTLLSYLTPEGQEEWKNDYFYVPYTRILKLDKSGEQVTDGAVMYILWPSMYWYDQVFNYQGQLDADGNIPLEERDMSIVPPSVLFNNPSQCRTFSDNGNFYTYNKETGTMEAWGMIPGEVRGSALLKGAEATVVTSTTDPSTIELREFDLEDSYTDVKFTINLATEKGATGTLKATYQGEGTVEGFEPTYVSTPEMVNIHLFNGGVVSSDILDADNPFPELFDEVAMMFLVAGGEKCNINVPASGKFGAGMYSISFKEGVENKDVNIVEGYVYLDAKYGKDTSADPTDCVISLLETEVAYDSFTDEYYLSCFPETDTMVPYGYDYQWSEDYGMKVYYNNGLQYIVNPSKIEWGSTEGFAVDVKTMYQRFISSFGKGNIVYHYDPSDVSKTRTFSSVGTREYVSGVNDVKVEKMTAKVVARNGQIAVVAGEKAPIAVYTLDGKLVKAANAEALSVEAPKGMYVVRVGNTAKKVVL